MINHIDVTTRDFPAPRLPKGRRQERIAKLLEELRYELHIGLIEGDQVDQILFRFMCPNLSGGRYWAGVFRFSPHLSDHMAFSPEWHSPPQFGADPAISSVFPQKSGNPL